MQKAYTFRNIQPQDNEQVAQVIRTVMTEFGATGEGYSINDPEVDHMYENYATSQTAFFVIEQAEIIYGCGGIGPLIGGADDICELKKMYFLPALRRQGWGKRLVKEALAAAKAMGYKRCYLETVERMWQANALYQKMGFRRISQPLGNTGHNACDVQYLLDLT
jgi:putative acetyltransferase